MVPPLLGRGDARRRRGSREGAADDDAGAHARGQGLGGELVDGYVEECGGAGGSGEDGCWVGGKEVGWGGGCVRRGGVAKAGEITGSGCNRHRRRLIEGELDGLHRKGRGAFNAATGSTRRIQLPKRPKLHFPFPCLKVNLPTSTSLRPPVKTNHLLGTLQRVRDLFPSGVSKVSAEHAEEERKPYRRERRVHRVGRGDNVVAPNPEVREPVHPASGVEDGRRGVAPDPRRSARVKGLAVGL